MLERASLFLLGGGAYAALELAWRGTTHWTMFLTGGVCLCLLQALADRPLPPLSHAVYLFTIETPDGVDDVIRGYAGGESRPGRRIR